MMLHTTIQIVFDALQLGLVLVNIFFFIHKKVSTFSAACMDIIISH